MKSPNHALQRTAPCVAELGVVRRRSRHPMNENPNRFAEPPDEPLFTAISQTDAAFQSAYDRAAATIPQFIAHIESAPDAFRSAKLRFRDPDESERLGEDRFLFL